MASHSRIQVGKSPGFYLIPCLKTNKKKRKLDGKTKQKRLHFISHLKEKIQNYKYLSWADSAKLKGEVHQI